MLDKIITLFIAWRQRRYATRKLNQLDDRLLLDVGTEREQIEQFVRERA